MSQQAQYGLCFRLRLLRLISDHISHATQPVALPTILKSYREKYIGEREVSTPALISRFYRAINDLERSGEIKTETIQSKNKTPLKRILPHENTNRA